MSQQQGTLAIRLGKLIRERRVAQSLRLVDVSLLSGVALATLSDLENGARDTRLSSYQRVLDALGVDLEEVFSQGRHEARASTDGYDLDGDL